MPSILHRAGPPPASGQEEEEEEKEGSRGLPSHRGRGQDEGLGAGLARLPSRTRGGAGTDTRSAGRRQGARAPEGQRPLGTIGSSPGGLRAVEGAPQAGFGLVFFQRRYQMHREAQLFKFLVATKA